MSAKSDKRIVAECNELARQFYAMQGYQQPKSFKFYTATHPHEVLMWRLAVLAYERIEATDVGDALNNIEDCR